MRVVESERIGHAVPILLACVFVAMVGFGITMPVLPFYTERLIPYAEWALTSPKPRQRWITEGRPAISALTAANRNSKRTRSSTQKRPRKRSHLSEEGRSLVALSTQLVLRANRDARHGDTMITLPLRSLAAFALSAS